MHALVDITDQAQITALSQNYGIFAIAWYVIGLFGIKGVARV